ncbi:hypothetical protein OIV83_000339 [Microbotryomycetes sp. JL201]|nr:hypothetical protein OIV83_000339 [Microbotryomycetes sp. JL201]
MVGWEEQELETPVTSSDANRITRTTMPLKIFSVPGAEGPELIGDGKAHYIMTYLSNKDAPREAVVCRFNGIISIQGSLRVSGREEPVEGSFVLEEHGVWSKEPTSEWKILNETIRGGLKDLLGKQEISGGSVHTGGHNDPSEGWLDLELA